MNGRQSTLVHVTRKLIGSPLSTAQTHAHTQNICHAMPCACGPVSCCPVLSSIFHRPSSPSPHTDRYRYTFFFYLHTKKVLLREMHWVQEHLFVTLKKFKNKDCTVEIDNIASHLNLSTVYILTNLSSV